MNSRKWLPLLILPAMAIAQEQPPQGGERWGVLVAQTTIIEAQMLVRTLEAPGVRPHTYVAGTGSHMQVVVFPDRASCENARATAFNPEGLTVPIGTGSTGVAHIGRTVSPCFRQP